MNIVQRFKSLLIPIITGALFSVSVVPSLAEDNLIYHYDDLNRLIRIEDMVANKVVEYIYDEVGNRTSKASYLPLTITASMGSNGSISPSGSVSVSYKTNQTFTMTPNSGYEILNVLVDTTSVGYENTYTFTSVTANHTINVTFQTLKSPYYIGSTGYATLQAAYDAASNGVTIKAKAKTYTENLNVNRNISVSIEGGYDPGFAGITGTTKLKGKIQTFSGGGTLTIKNFVLNNQ